MISQRSDNWKPPGDLVGSVNNKDQTYEVWRSSLTSPIAKQLLQRVQILVPFFIEGGSCIEEEELDSRWDIFFFYQNEPGEDGEPSYIFAGYSTVYRFFFLLKNESQAASKDPDSLLGADFDPSTLPCRSRISQFLVLPPFQGQGLGPKFYNVIYNTFLNHAPTMEITVEDPNENFDDLRDIADLRFLREKADFTSLKINTDLKFDGKNRKVPADLVDRRAWETVRRKYKIAPRQFARVVELFLMSQLPSTIRAVFPSQCTNAQKPTKEDQHQYRLWKLLVKERIYRKNKDTLGQLELHERIAKLEETLSSVEFDYARLLEKDARDDSEPSSNGHGKRKLDDSEDAVSKRVRLDDQEGTASEKGATGL